jgi:hypothetical protein
MKAKSPVKKAVISMLTGVAGLGLASVCAGLFGAQIMVNVYTVFVALALGIPGVLLVILKMFVI